MTVDDSELNDFRAALRRHGLAESGFDVSSLERPLPVGRISPTTGMVTVRNKKTGAKRTYEAGHGTAWVVQFEKDLNAGHFAPAT
jgi:hypothetical protein